MDNNAWRTPRVMRKWLASYARTNNIRIIGDACASHENHLEDVFWYYTAKEDAMQQNWSKAENVLWTDFGVLETVGKKDNIQPVICCKRIQPIDYWFINHPYNKSSGYEPTAWFKKAYNQALKGIGVIMLVQAPCGEKYRWGKYVFGKATTIYNVEGRVAFGHPDTGKESKGADFGSQVIIYDPKALCDRGCNSEGPKMFDTVIKPLYL